MTRRCFPYFVYTLPIVIASTGYSNQCWADDSAELNARFMTEAPQKWAEYRKRGKRLQGSCLLIGKKVHDGRERTIRVRYEVKQNSTGASFLKQMLEGDKTNYGIVTVVNSRYGFKLQRSKQESDWFVGGINLKLENGYKLDAFPPDLFACDFVNRAFNFSLLFSMSQSLPELIKDPDFSITKVSLSASRVGDELVRIEFSNHPHLVTGQQFKQNNIPNEWNDLTEGWVLLDPAHYWVFREYHVINEWQNHVTATTDAKFDYKIGRDGFPILTRIESQSNGRDTREQGSLEFDLTEQDVSDNQFTLSAYGFPEPKDVERRLPLYLWIALAGLFCLIAAALIRWLYYRGKTVATLTPNA